MDIVDGMTWTATRQRRTDTSAWPVDVQEVIEAVSELWRLRPPTTKQSKSYWIQSARELKDACGEYTVYELLDVVHETWLRKMREIKERTGQGCAPYIVEGPNSLVKVARAQAGEWRANGSGNDADKYRKCPYCGGKHLPQDCEN